MTWLQNAFDSVPHEWLMKKLLLEKLPEHLIRAIENSITMHDYWTFKRERRSDCFKYVHSVKEIFQGSSVLV